MLAISSQRYQEKHFACRSLTFANGTVSLECHSGFSFDENCFEDTSVVEKPRNPPFPGDKNDMGEIEGHIQNYSDRQLTSEMDIYRAFAGVARQVRRDLKSDMCHGLPTRFFDWFLLWQPLREDAPARRTVAPSWSWAGWNGPSWSRIWDWYTRDMQVVERGIKKRTWIVWYQRLAHSSTLCEPVMKLRKNWRGRQLNLYGGKARKKERFRIDCSVTKPTARTLTADGLPSYTDDLLSETPGSGFLQFWTVSAVFELRGVGTGDDGGYGPRIAGQPGASPASSLRDEWLDVDSNESDDARSAESDDLPLPDGISSDDIDPEFDPDKQPGVKLIIGGRSGRAIGRIYVPTWWRGLAEINSSDGPCQYEFILLCEARDKRAENFNLVDEDGGWRYRVMLLEPKLGGQYFERVSVGSIGLDDLDDAVGGLTWKEFILG
ncbi:hypothetical protein VTK56DRAFT_4388 [Thermocarpiscus australiensis]